MSHRIHPSSSLPLSLTLYLPSPFLSSLISLPSPSASIFPSSPISPSSSLSPFSFLSYIYQSLNYAACRTQQSSHLLENLVHEHFEGLRYVRTERGKKREKRKRKLIIDVLYFQIVEINSRILTWPPPPPDPRTLTPHPNKSHKLKIYYTFIVLWKEKEEYETPLQIYPLLFLTNWLPYYNL